MRSPNRRSYFSSLHGSINQLAGEWARKRQHQDLHVPTRRCAGRGAVASGRFYGVMGIPALHRMCIRTRNSA